MNKKTERRKSIMYGLYANKDCFAYDKERNSCKALEYLVCKGEECPFYKTVFERCTECKATRKTMTCEECKRRGLK